MLWVPVVGKSLSIHINVLVADMCALLFPDFPNICGVVL